MPVADLIKESLETQSMIRKMFEEGKLLKKQYGQDKVFDFSLGNPDLEPPSLFNEVLLRFTNDERKGSHGYMANAGFQEVRDIIAQKASKEQNVNIDGSHIIMSCGAAGGLNVVFKAILNPKDEVIVPCPYFMEYRPYALNHGGRIVEAATLPDFSLDLNAIKEKLSSKTAAVLINSPNNPTGKIYTAKAIADLAAIMEEHGKKCGRMPYLVSDEPYRDIVYNNIVVPPILSTYKESIVVFSYSKSLSLSGERIGYIAVSPDISDKENLLAAMVYATRILGYVNAPALMQRMVAELVSSKVAVEVYARRCAAFTKVLDEAGIEYSKPEGAFYLFCKVPARNMSSAGSSSVTAAGDDRAFVEHLKSYLILGVPGSGFGKPGWLRLAYCVDEKVINASGPAFKKAMEEW